MPAILSNILIDHFRILPQYVVIVNAIAILDNFPNHDFDCSTLVRALIPLDGYFHASLQDAMLQIFGGLEFSRNLDRRADIFRDSEIRNDAPPVVNIDVIPDLLPVVAVDVTGPVNILIPTEPVNNDQFLRRLRVVHA